MKIVVINEHGVAELVRIDRRIYGADGKQRLFRSGLNIHATDYMIFWRRCWRRVHMIIPGQYYVRSKGKDYYLELRL